MQAAASQVVLITGAKGGLGSALVETFRDAGFTVVATARRPSEGVSLPKVEWEPLDVLDAEACDRTIETVFAHHGRLDVLVHNASGYSSGSLGALTLDEIELDLATTLRAPIVLSRAFLRRARDQGFGRIVFVASTAGLSGEPGCGEYAVYSAAKAGIIRFAEALQEDIRRLGMQTLVVVPGNLRAEEEPAALEAEQAVSYRAAAAAIVAATVSSGNLSIARLDLRPARIAQ